MDFTSAVEYLAAIIVIVAAGALLGVVLRQRSRSPELALERIKTYTEIISLMDGLRLATAAHKRHFVDAYYQGLLYAPDEVLQAVNRYVQAVTQGDSEFDPAAVAEARDAAVRAMRVDTQNQSRLRTSVPSTELYSIEVSDTTHWQASRAADDASEDVPVVDEDAGVGDHFPA